MRKRQLFIILTLLCSLLFTLEAYAQLPQISTGLSYLSSSQNPDGTWGSVNSIAETTTATISALETLKLLNQTAGTPYTTGKAWLQTQAPLSVAYIAERIHALSLTDVNALIATLGQQKQSWGGDEGHVANNLDTALALQALKSANYPDQTVIFGAIGYLLSDQNTDGGWGFIEGESSNVFVTAHVLSTLNQFQTTYLMNQQIGSAAAFLLSSQNPDGSFGGSTVFETALALIALSESGQGQAQPLQNAVNYLTATQAANGSWNDDPYATALALRALAYVQPNLTISSADITFSKSLPLAGETVTISAVVRNSGLDSAAGAAVRFYLGDPASGGTPIGADQTISLLPAGGSAQVSVTTSFATSGGKTVFVRVDPTDSLAETTKADNLASARIWIATPPDLAVVADDLVPASHTPAAGTPFALGFSVRNLGESDAGAFSVALYDGDPANSGTLLQTAALSGISGGTARSGSIAVTLATNGPHTLYLVADSSNQLIEQSKANNSASVTVNVGATPTLTDLVISQANITLNPTRPRAGETVQISATVFNGGSEAANSFTVELFDGAPEAGGLRISSQTISLAAGSSRTVSADWAITAGVHDLYVVLDRANLVIESSENNNRVSIPVMTDMVDIAMSASDLSFTPAHPVNGDPVVLSVVAHNRGIKATGPFSLALYNGDPATGSTLLQTFAIADLAGDASMSLSYPFVATPGVYRFYALADPEQSVAELTKSNNLAIRSLTIKAPGELAGPDLVPVSLDLDDTVTDAQSLAISGTAHVTFQNKGDEKITTPFQASVFEDLDNDGRYTAGIDTLLGSAENGMALWPEGANRIDVTLAGTVRFLHAPLYAFIDAGDAILEQNEDNNSIRSGATCENRPGNPIDPVVKWWWNRTSDAMFTGNPALIAPLIDTNGDGNIDDRDVPALLFGSGFAGYSAGNIIALRGDTGQEIFTSFDPNHLIDRQNFAIGDIDNDGFNEIIVPRALGQAKGGYGVLAFDHLGKIKWDSRDIAANDAFPISFSGGAVPIIADLDNDGNPEIIIAATVFNNNGTIKWSVPFSNIGVGPAPGGISTAVDLDLDGKLEVIAGNSAYRADGTVKWRNSALRNNGMGVIANFNDDPYPEIIYFTTDWWGAGTLYLLDHNGNIIWGPVSLKALEPGMNGWTSGTVPVIADYDGDGEAEIGIKGTNNFFILDRSGAVKQTLNIPANENGPENISPTVFDLDGDGRPEVIINSDDYFRIFDGKTGQELFHENEGYLVNINQYSRVTVADVDNDGHVEIVVTDNHNDPRMYGDAVRVYGARNNNWMASRKIWNQLSYHVTNVNDDGSIPQYEAPGWLLNNSYHCQARTASGASPYLTPNLTASAFRAQQNGADLSLSVRIGNGGAIDAPAGAMVTFYDGPPETGTIIGTQSTTQPLRPGEFQDIAIIWQGAATGLHHLYAVVDAANSVSECRKDDNRAQVDLTIASGVIDLRIGAEDIQLPPAPHYASLPLPVTATVRNSGSIPAANVTVRFYVGNPAAGGQQLGSDQVIPIITAGGAGQASVVWNAASLPGTAYLYAVADPAGLVADANRANNAAMTAVQTVATTRPDLLVTGDDIVITPALPAEGDQLAVIVTIRNQGAATGNVKVALYKGDPAAGGSVVGTILMPQIIATGGSTQATFTLETLGLAGNLPLFVVVDPDNLVDELGKANNRASRTVAIAAAGLSIGLQTDKSAYSANEAVQAAITLTNGKTAGRSLTYDLLVLDADGQTVATAAGNVPLVVGPGAAQSVTAGWNTATTYAGSYLLSVIVRESGRLVARGTAPLTIQPVKSAAVVLTADRLAYGADSTAVLSAAITGTSPNYQFTGLSGRLTITGSSGEPVYSQSAPLATLLPGARITRSYPWSIGKQAAGTYTATFELLDGAACISSATATFAVSASSSSGTGVTGSLLLPAAVDSGAEVNVAYSVTNGGNDTLAGFDLALLIIDPLSGQLLKSLPLLSGESLGVNGTLPGTAMLPTLGIKPGNLLTVLQYGSQGVIRSIASAPLALNDTTPPVLTVSTLADGSYSNQEILNIAGTASDNSGTVNVTINGYAVPLAADGSFSHALPLLSGPNTITVIAADPSDNKTTDSRTINLDQTAPKLIITNPADNYKTAVGLLEVSGTVDETATVTVKLGENSQTAAMNGTSFTAMVNLPYGGSTIDITARDLAGNPSSQKRTVLFDDQVPSLEISEPPQDIRTNKSSLTVGGKTGDLYSEVGITVAVDGTVMSPPVVNGIFSQVVTFTEEKLYPILITASNEVGTQTTALRNVIFDKTPPVLTIDPVTSPTNAPIQTVTGTREEGTEVTVSCPTATVGTVEYPAATTWQTVLSNMQPGENRLRAEATDLAKNLSAVAATILYVPQAPDINISASPQQLWPPNKKLVAVKIDGNIVTHGSDVKEATVSVADEYGKYNLQGVKFGDTVWLEAWREGNDQDGRVYTITAVVTDQAGNRTTKTATVIVPHDMGK